MFQNSFKLRTFLKVCRPQSDVPDRQFTLIWCTNLRYTRTFLGFFKLQGGYPSAPKIFLRKRRPGANKVCVDGCILVWLRLSKTGTQFICLDLLSSCSGKLDATKNWVRTHEMGRVNQIRKNRWLITNEIRWWLGPQPPQSQRRRSPTSSYPRALSTASNVPVSINLNLLWYRILGILQIIRVLRNFFGIWVHRLWLIHSLPFIPST